MRRKISQALKRELNRRIKAEFPEFKQDVSLHRKVNQAIKKVLKIRMKEHFSEYRIVKHERLPPGSTAWCCVKGSLWLVVIYHPSDKWESFTIELAWSRKNQFPDYILSLPKEFEDDGLIRLGHLSEGRDFWWMLEDKAPVEEFDPMAFLNEPPVDEWLARVEPTVDDAMKNLIQFGLPFFQKVEACYSD